MKEAWYFSHDYHARNDIKLVSLRMEMGMNGIGIYWCLVEMLYEENGRISLKLLKNISDVLGCTKADVQKVITEFDLFDFDDDHFWSDSIINRIEARENRKVRAKENADKRWNKDEPVKKRKSFAAPSEQEVVDYFIMNGFKESAGKKAFKYYNDAEWKDSRDNQVKNWKQKMQAVWFKDEHKELLTTKQSKDDYKRKRAEAEERERRLAAADD